MTAYSTAVEPTRNGARDLIDNGGLRITLADVGPQTSHEDC